MKTRKKTIKASLKIWGKVYTSKGKTVEEVITNFKVPTTKGIGVLVLEKGDLKKEKVLSHSLINGTFGIMSPTMKTIAIKNIITLFSNFDDE